MSASKANMSAAVGLNVVVIDFPIGYVSYPPLRNVLPKFKPMLFCRLRFNSVSGIAFAKAESICMNAGDGVWRSKNAASNEAHISDARPITPLSIHALSLTIYSPFSSTLSDSQKNKHGLVLPDVIKR
jgi:hypothetical protein